MTDQGLFTFGGIESLLPKYWPELYGYRFGLVRLSAMGCPPLIYGMLRVLLLKCNVLIDTKEYFNILIEIDDT